MLFDSVPESSGNETACNDIQDEKQAPPKYVSCEHDALCSDLQYANVLLPNEVTTGISILLSMLQF